MIARCSQDPNIIFKTACASGDDLKVKRMLLKGQVDLHHRDDDVRQSVRARHIGTCSTDVND